MASPCIGLFDSGIGGLSILREVRRLLPAEDLVYVADQAHVPYGSRPKEEVRSFSEAITRFLIDRQAKLVVVACNTASAVALHPLRRTFPQVPFVGMEPAVKPAAQATRSGVVGVLATPATFQGELFASVVERFAAGVRVVEQTAPGLVEQIEAGDLDGPVTRGIVDRALRPLLEQGADAIVLGCTHYPFVIPLIQELAGPNVQVIDPSPAIARQTQRLLAEKRIAADGVEPGRVVLYTSGDTESLQAWSARAPEFAGEIERAQWIAGTLATVA
ncbi:MAG TPA: glutamate racemase [Anaerolineales bacterium]|nr:glutamate racemase [Anaerolineales bacterium]